MRADSIRDRYAKGVSLLGLGLLAGTGALVDYWPTRGQLPLVAPIDHGELVRPALPASPDPLSIVVRAPAGPSRIVAPAVVPPARVLRVGTMARLAGTPVALVAPALEPRRAEATATVEPLAVLASSASATTGAASLILPPLARPRLTASWADEAEDDGFLTGAVKRTGVSILRTSARAGASVFDAFRSLGGAVKRALPN